MRSLRWLGLFLVVLILAIGALIFFVPFVWMVFGVFKTSSELTMMNPRLLPDNWQFANFARLFRDAPYGWQLLRRRQILLL